MINSISGTSPLAVPFGWSLSDMVQWISFFWSFFFLTKYSTNHLSYWFSQKKEAFTDLFDLFFWWKKKRKKILWKKMILLKFTQHDATNPTNEPNDVKYRIRLNNMAPHWKRLAVLAVLCLSVFGAISVAQLFGLGCPIRWISVQFDRFSISFENKNKFFIVIFAEIWHSLKLRSSIYMIRATWSTVHTLDIQNDIENPIIRVRNDFT